jgi:hypothetical protein
MLKGIHLRCHIFVGRTKIRLSDDQAADGKEGESHIIHGN